MPVVVVISLTFLENCAITALSCLLSLRGTKVVSPYPLRFVKAKSRIAREQLVGEVHVWNPRVCKRNGTTGPLVVFERNRSTGTCITHLSFADWALGNAALAVSIRQATKATTAPIWSTKCTPRGLALSIENTALPKDGRREFMRAH